MLLNDSISKLCVEWVVVLSRFWTVRYYIELDVTTDNGINKCCVEKVVFLFFFAFLIIGNLIYIAVD